MTYEFISKARTIFIEYSKPTAQTVSQGNANKRSTGEIQ